MMNSNTQRKLGYLFLLLGVLAFSFYWGLASYRLLDNNEGLYAEVAREMLVTGNYMIPHLNFLPYLEKPPLFYWLLVMSFHYLGPTTLAARLVPAGSAALTCLTLFFFGLKIKRPQMGYLAALVLASSLGFQIIAREVFFDMFLTLCMTVGLLAFYLWYQEEKKYYLRIAYFFAGAVILIKSLVGVTLMAGIAVLFMLVMKTPRRKFVSFFDGIGIALFLLVALPWHVMASLSHPGFFQEFFINEQYLRFLDQRIPHDYYTGPFYYYIPRVFIYLLPWSLLLPAVCLQFKKFMAEKNPWAIFLGIWFLVPLVFFSFSAAKANYYMIVGVPPLAFLISLRLQAWFENRRSLPLIILLSFLLVFAGALFSSSHFWLEKYAERYLTLLPLMQHIAIFTLVYAALSGIVFGFYFRKPETPFFLILGFMLGLAGFLVTGAKQLEADLSAASIGRYLQASNQQSPLYFYQNFEELSSLLFYRQARVAIIDSHSNDLCDGRKDLQVGQWFPTASQFQTIAQKNKIYVVLLNNKVKKFTESMPNTHFYALLEDSKVTLLTN